MGPGVEEKGEGPDFDSEDARVFRYRLRQFEKLGFREDQAAELAAADADHHEAERLLEHGCSKRNVLRLLT